MPRKHDPAREHPVSWWVPASAANRDDPDEYPSAQEVREFLERVRKQAAERRGKPYVPPKPVRGRPSDSHWVTCHDWAELIAKYRDNAWCWEDPKHPDRQQELRPVWSCFPPRGEGDVRDVIDKVLFHRHEDDVPAVIPSGWEKNPRRSLYRLWAELQSAFPRPHRKAQQRAPREPRRDR